MKTRIQKILFIIPIITFLFFVSVSFAQNTQNYSVLQPLPGIGDGQGTTGREITLSQYLPAVFNLAVGVSIALAFIFITIGGITYATSDSFSGKEDGRNYIKNAVTGLLLVIGSYVILYTINPQILNFNVTFLAAPAQQNNPTVTGVTTPFGNCLGGGCLAFAGTGLPATGSAVGSGVSVAMMPKLLALNTALNGNNPPISWRITEGGYNASIVHQSQCHNQGTCVDATPVNKIPINLNAFVTYAQQNGLSPIFEVETDVECFNLKSTVNRDGSPRRNPDGSAFVPYTGPILVLGPNPRTGQRQITGSHFSVYDYSRTAPTTCP
ncbi:MAG TPA: pilin [Parcubacteria group bacterium]|jgi:hypothetical protein|nr:pilin [Parcubacteria group bacterium]